MHHSTFIDGEHEIRDAVKAEQEESNAINKDERVVFDENSITKPKCACEKSWSERKTAGLERKLNFECRDCRNIC